MTVYIFKKKTNIDAKEILDVINADTSFGESPELSEEHRETMMGVYNSTGDFVETEDIVIDTELDFTTADIPLNFCFGNGISTCEIKLVNGRKVNVVIVVFNKNKKTAIMAKRAALRAMCQQEPAKSVI